MLIYKFIKDNKIIEVKIKLLENSFVDSWVKYMLELYPRVKRLHWYMTKFAYRDRYLKPNQLPVNLSRLHASFLFFHKHKVDDYTNVINRIEYLLNRPEETTQDDLNIWHRHFTTLEGKYSLHPHKTPPNTLTMDLYEYIHDVNQYTHKLEGYTYFDCERRKLHPDSKMYAVQFTNANNMTYFAENDNKNVWDGSTPRLQAGFYDYLQKQDYDHSVWLHEDIIGKDQIKAWLDHDDLSQFDVTGNDCMTPNVSFDPGKFYHKILSNPEFQEASKASGKTLDRPPLGDIINIPEINFEALLTSRVESVILNGTQLWHYGDII